MTQEQRRTTQELRWHETQELPCSRELLHRTLEQQWQWELRMTQELLWSQGQLTTAAAYDTGAAAYDTGAAVVIGAASRLCYL